MRSTLAAALACVLATTTIRAGDRDDALAIIDQAVQAQGGADALAKLRTAVRRGEGFLFQGDDKQPFTDEMTLDLPDRWRLSLDIDKQTRFTLAVAGDKGWEALGGKVEDIGPERLKEMREEIYVLWLQTLLPLRKDGFDLAPLPEAKVDGQAVVGVKASSKDRPDVKLYFDKTTHRRPGSSGAPGGAAAAKAYLLGDYPDFDGVKMPTHLVETTDGKKISELTSAVYKFPSKADDAAFTKP